MATQAETESIRTYVIHRYGLAHTEASVLTKWVQKLDAENRFPELTADERLRLLDDVVNAMITKGYVGNHFTEKILADWSALWAEDRAQDKRVAAAKAAFKSNLRIETQDALDKQAQAIADVEARGKTAEQLQQEAGLESYIDIAGRKKFRRFERPTAAATFEPLPAGHTRKSLLALANHDRAQYRTLVKKHGADNITRRIQETQ